MGVLTEKIEAANAVGIANLNDKGVELGEDATTYEIMSAIGEISSGDTEELEQLIDNSGVLDSTEGSVSEKVEELIEKASVKGIIFSDFTGSYNTPRVADMSSLTFPNNAHNMYFPYCFKNVNTTGGGGYFIQLEEVYLPKNLKCIYGEMFYCCVNLRTLHGDLTKIEAVNGSAFHSCSKLTKFPHMPSLTRLDANAFNGCTGLTEVKFYNTLTSCAANAFNGCSNLTDIYCPWAEGEVANAPWGATNATIHYNWVEEVATNEAD